MTQANLASLHTAPQASAEQNRSLPENRKLPEDRNQPLHRSRRPLRKLSPLTFLPGLVFWPFMGVAIYREDETMLSIGAVGIFALLAVMLVRKLKKSSEERAEEGRIWREGVPATATIVHIATRGSMNYHPNVEFELDVKRGDAPAYRVHTEVLINKLAVPRIQPGMEIEVRIDPQDGSRVAIDEGVTYLGYA